MVILHASAYCMVVHIFTGRVWTYADLTQAAKALEFESRFFAVVFASKQVSIIFDIVKICFFRSFDLWHCNITAPRARGRPGLGRFSPTNQNSYRFFPAPIPPSISFRKSFFQPLPLSSFAQFQLSGNNVLKDYLSRQSQILLRRVTRFTEPGKIIVSSTLPIPLGISAKIRLIGLPPFCSIC
jgi:hypothetical protein